MNYIKRLLFTLLIFSTSYVLSQDIGAVSISIPISTGCNIGSQQIQADVFNYDASTLNGSFDVAYQLDNNTPVSQTSLNLFGFTSGDTRTITFTTNLDLTGNYGVHTLKVFTQLGSDTDNTNDTTTITITNYEPTNGGVLTANDTVCQTANYDTLILDNEIGDVVEWQYDNGLGWSPLAITDTFYIYNNLSVTTKYRVRVQNGTCAEDYSNEVTITVDTAADAGTLSASKTVCLGDTGDTLTLSGYYGNITKWQFNNGGGWTDIANTTDTLTYGTLSTTTSYRTILDTGICNPDTSNVVTITVVSATVPGNLLANDTVCVNNNRDTLILTNSVGNIIQWESSDDSGFTWTPIVNTDTFQIYNNLPNTRMYRVLVQASGCASLYSDTVTIKTLPTPVGGTIDGDNSICGGTNTDTLYLLGYTGDIVKWQFNNGGGWTDITNTTDTLIVNNLIVTTSYRAIVGNGGICANDTSTVATLTVIATTIGGNIVQSDSVCMGANFDTLTLIGHVGDIRWWERSTDNGISWTPIANVDTFQVYSNLTQTTWYRVLVEGTSCPNDYSDTAIITVYTPSLTITPQDTTTFCMGDSVILDATLGYTTYAWNNGDNTSSTVAKTTGNYKVTITDFRGCINSDSVDVTVNPLPVADAGDDVTISLGSSTVLNGTGGDTYLWSPGVSLSDVNAQNPVASPDTTTEYTLLVTDLNGCQDYDSVIVTVNKDFAFAPKNVITPNGDGYNDTWKVDNLEAYPECTVIILNRYGAVIYETKGYNNTWDGKSNGEVVSDGTYYYVITCVGTDQVLKGHITVLSK